MKRYFVFLALWLGSLLWAGAQVSVEVLMDQEQFLRDESLPLKVRINNLSGQTLLLGQDTDWLTFQVLNQNGLNVTKTGPVPVQEEYALQSAQAAIRRVDIMPYFDLSRPGRYSVTATVKIKQWNQEFTSRPKSFEIASGFKIWEQEFGVPGSKGPPEVRKYTLEQANYVKRMMLYLRLTDAKDSQVYRVLPLGPLVSFSRPEAQVDKSSNLHVLSQAGGWGFIYVAVNPQGTVLLRQRYEYTATRPVLRSTEDGRVVVVGGIRKVNEDDFPPPIIEPATNEVAAPKTATNNVAAPKP